MKIADTLKTAEQFLTQQFTTARQSGFFTEWLEAVPSEPKEGHSWFVVDSENGVRRDCLKVNGELYPHTHPFWEMSKVLVIYNFAHLFFAAHYIKQLAVKAYQIRPSFSEVFKNYKVIKEDPGFTWSKFAETHRPLFSTFGEGFKPVAKSFALFSALYFDPTIYGVPLGTSARWIVLSCFVLKPLSFRIFLDHVENWWLAEAIQFKNVKEWSVMDQFNSLAHLFNMERLEKN